MIRFIELLTVPSGVGSGGPFKLRPWQKEFIKDIYEPVDRGGKRFVRRAILSIGRKNGKTALIAALVLVHLVGPEAVMNGEIYSAANERTQAAQVYKVAAQFVRADPELSAMVRCVDSTKTIACYANGSAYQAVSAKAGTKHGLNPTVVIYDELAQSKGRDLYEALDTSMGAREEALFVTISTQSHDPQHILSELIDAGVKGDDPARVVHLYAVPDDAEDIFDERIWYQANPALGDFRLLSDFRALAREVQDMPSKEASFRNYYLNQRYNSVAPIIPQMLWRRCKARETIEPGEKIYLGLDLSAVQDLTALVAVSAENGDRLKAWAWKPADLVKLHTQRDGANYQLWRDQGWLLTAPGDFIDYAYVAEHVAEIGATYDVLGLAYDRWRIKEFKKCLSAIGVHAFEDDTDKGGADMLRMIGFGQGFKDMGPAVDAFEQAVLRRTLKHDGNPVLTFCMLNAVAEKDPAGNRKPHKTKSRFRIDAAVAAIMAVGLKARDRRDDDDDGSDSYLDHSGLIILG